MQTLDFYILGSFFIALVSSIITGFTVYTLLNNRHENMYVELNISPEQIKTEAAMAVNNDCHTLVLPEVAVGGNQNKLLRVAFVDQRLRLDMIYQNLGLDNDEDGETIRI